MVFKIGMVNVPFLPLVSDFYLFLTGSSPFLAKYTTRITKNWQLLNHFTTHKRLHNVNVHPNAEKGTICQAKEHQIIGSLISLAIRCPTSLFMLLIGRLNTRIQKYEFQNFTLLGLIISPTRLIRINLQSKNQGLLSTISCKLFSLAKNGPKINCHPLL